MSFSFGGGNTTGGTGGFSFGATTTASATPSTGGFSFGAPVSSSASSTGFGFGAPAATTAAPSTGFGFGAAAATQAAAPSSGFSFGGPAASTAPAFGAPAAAPSTIAAAAPPAFGAAASAPAFSTLPSTPVSAPAFGAVTALGTPATSAGPPAFGTATAGFGAPAASLTSSATSAPPSFGTGSSLTFGGSSAPPNKIAPLGFGAPTTNPPTLGASAAISGFGTSVTTAVPASSAPATGFGFAAPATSSAPGLGLKTGGSLTLGTPISATTTVAAVAPTNFSLGGTTTAVTKSPAFGVATVTSSTGIACNLSKTTTSSGFSLGGVTPSSISLGGTTITSVAPQGSITSTSGGFGLPVNTGASSASTVGFTLSTTTSTTASLTSTTSTVASSITPATNLTFHQLEENINKWSLELEDQEKMFLNQATMVNAWDQLLIKNGEKIVGLNENVAAVRLDQQRLEHELDFVASQQAELEAALAPLESSLTTGGAAVDTERERTYSLAESLDGQLARMCEDLKEVIGHLNSSARVQDNRDPVHQIGKVLNAHMDSLQWIDSQAGLVERKLSDVTRLAEVHKRDNERLQRSMLE